jgi:hypothetical protein
LSKKHKEIKEAYRELTGIRQLLHSCNIEISPTLYCKLVHQSIENLCTATDNSPIVEYAHTPTPEACRFTIDTKLIADFLIGIYRSHLAVYKVTPLAGSLAHHLKEGFITHLIQRGYLSPESGSNIKVTEYRRLAIDNMQALEVPYHAVFRTVGKIELHFVGL